MNTRSWLVALAAIAAPLAVVHGLTPPSASDGPVKLLTCVVSPQGVLEAEVDSQTDDAMDCNIRCNYELGEKMFSQSFSVTIPARFHGRVGRFDTSNAKAGNYSGDIGTCKKSPR
ncbi:MAG TPA: hypothetical protein VGO61_03460 [Steroidobacteraceae bacterium]|jgi:hypothetical protein|nr:hypothetical protein [Steroidobacteraceae bacterium]